MNESLIKNGIIEAPLKRDVVGTTKDIGTFREGEEEDVEKPDDDDDDEIELFLSVFMAFSVF